MGVAYIVDTNIISELMRPQPNVSVQAKWRQYSTQIALTSISWHELHTGVERMQQSQRKNAFRAFLNHFQLTLSILPYDEVAARWHAIERARLMAIGRTPSYADGQIAAIAATNNFVLVTRNTADFAEYQKLALDNWFE